MNDCFWRRAEDLGIDRKTVTVLNVNQSSAVKCFEIVDYPDYFGKVYESHF